MRRGWFDHGKGQRTLRAIAAYANEHGYAPTYRELGERLGLSTSQAFRRVRRLRRAGLVTGAPAAERAISVPSLRPRSPLPEVEIGRALTARQAEVFLFLRAYTELSGHGPTLKEIGRGVGYANYWCVGRRLDELAGLGLIVRDATKPRGVAVIAQPRRCARG